MTRQHLTNILYQVNMRKIGLHLAELDGPGLVLGDAPQHVGVLGGQVAGEVLQWYLFSAVQSPLAGHTHPRTERLMLQPCLGVTSGEHCMTAKDFKLAGNNFLFGGFFTR